MSENKIKLSSQNRVSFGRKVKALRRQGIIPANVFGKNIKSISIQLNQKDFLKTFKTAGETSLVELSIDEKTSKPVLISAVQMHPVTNQIIHVDFHQVDLKEKVTATVPLEVVGESPAVKDNGAVLFHAVSELSVEALPAEIPSSIQIDISALVNVGDSLTIKDLKIDSSKITIDIAEDEPLILAQEPKLEEEPEVVVEVENEAASEETDSQADQKSEDSEKSEK